MHFGWKWKWKNTFLEIFVDLTKKNMSNTIGQKTVEWGKEHPKGNAKRMAIPGQRARRPVLPSPSWTLKFFPKPAKISKGHASKSWSRKKFVSNSEAKSIDGPESLIQPVKATRLESTELFIRGMIKKKCTERAHSLKSASNQRVSGQSWVQGTGKKENVQLRGHIHCKFKSCCNFQIKQLWYKQFRVKAGNFRHFVQWASFQKSNIALSYT